MTDSTSVQHVEEKIYSFCIKQPQSYKTDREHMDNSMYYLIAVIYVKIMIINWLLIVLFIFSTTGGQVAWKCLPHLCTEILTVELLLTLLQLIMQLLPNTWTIRQGRRNCNRCFEGIVPHSKYVAYCLNIYVLETTILTTTVSVVQNLM